MERITVDSKAEGMRGVGCTVAVILAFSFLISPLLPRAKAAPREDRTPGQPPRLAALAEERLGEVLGGEGSQVVQLLPHADVAYGDV